MGSRKHKRTVSFDMLLPDWIRMEEFEAKPYQFDKVLFLLVYRRKWLQIRGLTQAGGAPGPLAEWRTAFADIEWTASSLQSGPARFAH
jgi:hypothetical protein